MATGLLTLDATHQAKRFLGIGDIVKVLKDWETASNERGSSQHRQDYNGDLDQVH
jgi:hypothetical protein